MRSVVAAADTPALPELVVDTDSVSLAVFMWESMAAIFVFAGVFACDGNSESGFVKFVDCPAVISTPPERLGFISEPGVNAFVVPSFGAESFFCSAVSAAGFGIIYFRILF